MAKTGKALVKWDAELAKYAEASAAAESGGSGNFLSMKGGIMAFKGNPLPGNKIEVIVLAFVTENQFYDQDQEYDSDNPQSPICYAFGRPEPAPGNGRADDMVPHEEVPDKQCEACVDCPHFEWKSAKKGKGKACKEVRRLTMILADSVEHGAQGVEDAEEVNLKISVTNTKAWGGYVQQVAALKRPPFAVITEIAAFNDPKTQYRLQFKLVEQIKDAAVFAALMARVEESKTKIVAAYPVFDPEDNPPPKRNSRAKPQAKPAARGNKPTRQVAPARKAPAPPARPARSRQPAVPAAPAARTARQKY